jgi:mannose-1-phosphate guanylyltransferase/mannose-6-phosphate isomerase
MPQEPLVVLVAGGGGTRLWPLSRRHKPKQFLDLGTGKTLLQQTYARARIWTTAERIYVATTKEHALQVRKLLPQIPPERVFIEPARRDTGPAVTAAAWRLKEAGYGDTHTLFLWCDHVFTKERSFCRDLVKVRKLLPRLREKILIWGHVPSTPETGYGYLEVGECLARIPQLRKVKRFCEKPDLPTARRYVLSGHYRWNMGYFCVTPSFMLAELSRCAPELEEGTKLFVRAERGGQQETASKIYAQLPNISIDPALMERSREIVAWCGEYGWSDVGNWFAVRTLFGKEGDYAPKACHVHLDAADNYVYNATKRTVSLVGVKGLIVVVTEDAILIARQSHAHRVKDVVAKLEKEGLEKLL